MTNVSLFAGDNRVSLRRLIDSGVCVHSVVTDPPYGLVSVQKRFGKEGSAAARTEGNDGSFNRLSGGFMGKTWDGTGIERDPEFWKLIYDILLPGGYVFAFSGSRTGHWQACAMEMAGFIMHPMHGWVFGSGFPKAHNASKAIDKHLGVEGAKGDVRGSSGSVRNSIAGDFIGGEYHDYVPGSPDVAEWEGWAYGTQTQKPALEPIYLGQKPFSEKTGAANILKHGVGAVNIDGCRVGYINADDQGSAKPQGKATAKVGALAGKTQHDGERSEFVPDNSKGRHPSNLILDGSPEVVAMFPDSKSGVMKASTTRAAQDEPGSVCYGTYGGQVASQNIAASSGSAARFFHQFPQNHCCLCQQEVELCDVSIAGRDLTIQSIQTDASALSNAADLLQPESADKRKLSTAPVIYAERSSEQPRQTSSDFVRQNAAGSPEARIAHNAKCAANLCDSCATAFAQSLVQTSQGKSPESLLSRAFITERKRQILIQSLALIAATPESIVTTTTIQNLNLWFGFVFRAIEDATNSESPSRNNVSGGPLRYHPKAGKLDRAGSKHPTVKPIALMQYLIRHITPPGGTVLDPFAGSGTTAEAARREGFDCILMEAEPEYVDFLKTRFCVQERTDFLSEIDELSQLLG